MRELLRRLSLHPFLAFEICLASFFINLLSLASPIFVIQVLNRYVGYGFDGTLITLTVGMLIAGVLNHAFTVVRVRLASAVNVGPDRVLSETVLGCLARAKMSTLGRIPPARIHELMSGIQVVQSGYDASVICSVLDMPFLILFVGATFFLSPVLALITILAIACSMLAGWLNIRRGKRMNDAMRNESVVHRGNLANAISGADTVRAFGGRGYLTGVFQAQMDKLQQIKRDMVQSGTRGQAVLQSIAMLLRVMVYAVGAREVVAGSMSTGGLIGASILSGKALAVSASFMKSRAMIAQAGQMMQSLHEFVRQPLESETGTELKDYRGAIEIKDLGFAYPGSTGPLFEGLDVNIEPGNIVIVTGHNGAGKTSLVRLLLGLIDPGRGQILAGGVDVRQLSAPWWRKQVMYLPQEPTFLNASIRENICLNAPGMDDDRLNRVVEIAGLKKYLDTSVQGLEAQVVNGGAELAVGIRRRLALARALSVQGAVAVLDEPAEGFDIEGLRAMDMIIQSMVKVKKTMIIVSQDMRLMQRADIIIDLGNKPKPNVLHPKKDAAPKETEAPKSGGVQ
ncbi:ATP-binding cassette domain-containing protein [Maridesulfovibrio salexigens]|uniref:ABC transporter related n=1 Tax=Maridesulfovibrio salexigens (strain ATCC 14822 / DSM 2638 / NCIMB 8403 / VKM B-1763) TaxID=526222 RepID=C6C038_MARSD|nr:ATP-binding cassette domain-containing protein [Maridesulfovibrio salexigens]ACS80909.1 ABC transporter related [Maridesulfovibrio salexigens DSM 2638]